MKNITTGDAELRAAEKEDRRTYDPRDPTGGYPYGGRFEGDTPKLPEREKTRAAQPTEGQIRPRAAESVRNKIDPALLRHAQEIVECLPSADEIDYQLYLSSLVGISADLWETAMDASESHKDILSTLEHAAKLAATDAFLTPEQLGVIREAISFLARPTLVRSEVESVCRDFVDAGFPPLGFLE